MAFVGQSLCIVLGTWHIPLRDVSKAVNGYCIRRSIQQAMRLGQHLGFSCPRIGVCGLNPHAGENGLIGDEERNVINPQLKKLQKQYRNISECMAADTLFWRHAQGEFDILIAWYHDQALTAIKTLEFNSAVNITLGLPCIRTSPAHGTAYGLAGRGCADSTSFAQAVRLAKQFIAAIN